MFRIALLVLLTGLGFARPALAGPPLVVHPYNIGTARSLPWAGREGRTDYDRSHLFQDLDAVLSSSQSAIVHMETLRRAVIYARADRMVASDLLLRLIHLAMLSEQSATPNPLTYLDAAYMIEAIRQVDMLNEMAFPRVVALADLATGKDGAPWITKAIRLRPNDPALQLAASLIVEHADRAQSEHYMQLARAGADRDPLLAQNRDHLQMH